MLITGGKTSEHATKCSGCQLKEEWQTSGSVPIDSPLVSQLKKPTVTQTSRILASLFREENEMAGPNVLQTQAHIIKAAPTAVLIPIFSPNATAI